MSENLKPCPWCGSVNVTADNQDVDGVFCEGCGFYWSFDGSGEFDTIRTETIARWNTRPIEDALRAENERLRAMLRQLEAERRSLWRQTDAKEGTLLTYCAVHAVRWRPEWGEPQCGFIQATAPAPES